MRAHLAQLYFAKVSACANHFPLGVKGDYGSVLIVGIEQFLPQLRGLLRVGGLADLIQQLAQILGGIAGEVLGLGGQAGGHCEFRVTDHILPECEIHIVISAGVQAILRGVVILSDYLKVDVSRCSQTRL